ncbi:protein kinase activity protein [Tritrichomonas musculus]|uniref:Protein kinase activity protein n=1 Tax=Tritrichomonas musculus TaxID=1915356 RepID=A0ABR2KHQ9_9EUKA
MKVCGYNANLRLNEASNNTASKYQCISPPCDSHLNFSSLSSLSACHDHTIWITKEGEGYAVGSNRYGQILGTHKNEDLTKEELIELKDKEGRPCQIISAVCGYSYTLNNYGQLLTTEPGSTVHTPSDTTISSGASFSIAGRAISLVFVGTEPPPNTPNRPIRSIKEKVTPSDEILRLKEEIAALKEENERLRGQVSSSSTAGSLKLLDASTIESLDRCEEVGSGGFGRVYKVYKKEACALKEMNASEPIQRNFGYFLKECELLCMLRHPNIEKTFGIFMGDGDRRPCMLLEFCCQNLETAVKNKVLSGVESSFCLYQVAEGMKYVHSRGIIHRDLKPSNILFGSDGMIKIGDFGIARLVTAEEQSSMTRGFGTQKFMAPEIIDESDTYDEKVDVYSFGVLCFFVLSGGEMPKIKMSELLSGKKAAIPSSFSDISKSVISDCWNFESKDRPSFSEIVSRMEKNDYEMVPLEESQVRELKNKVKEHKAKIPPYK